MRFFFSFGLFAVALCLSGGVCAQADPLNRADELVAELRRGDFGEASKLFHYPSTYTETELIDDRAGVAQGLRTIANAIGPLQSVSRVPHPRGPLLSVGIGGADLAYWSSHPELGNSLNVTYRAVTSNDGEVYFVVRLIHGSFAWEVGSFALSIDEYRSGAAERIRELSRKFMP